MNPDWTLGRTFEEAVTDLRAEDNWEFHDQRFSLVNRAVQDVIERIVPIVYPTYQKSVVIQINREAKRSTTGTGTWTVETSRLVFANMSSDFESADVGKLLTMRVADDIYICEVQTRVDGDTVVLRGMLLPAADATVDEVQLLGTAVNDDPIDISGLRLIRSTEARITLESSALKEGVDAVSMEQLLAWRAEDIGTPQIVFALEGSKLRLRTRLSSYGVLTLHYPELPEEMDDDSDELPVPGASAALLVSIRLKKILSVRGKINLPDYSEEAAFAIGTLADTFKAVLSTEQLKRKVAALI